MTTWKLSQNGITAICSLANGHYESRLVSAIPIDDTILPADPLTSQEKRNAIQSQINTKEMAQLMSTTTRLMLIDMATQLATIAGISEIELYSINPEYKLVKDLEGEIAVLRAELAAIP